MKFFLSSIIICCLLSCNSEIKYPEGGYDYPKASEVTDTNFYFYPVRNIVSKQDSLNLAIEFLHYKAFNESNFSIKPLTNETFRFFSYSLGENLL